MPYCKLCEKIEGATRELQIKAEMLRLELLWNKGGNNESNHNSGPGSDCSGGNDCSDG